MTESQSRPTLLERLKHRKLVQWALAYLAGAWVVVQVGGELSDSWGWPAGLVQGIHVLLLVGFVGALVLAWYHGEQGRQRVSGAELLILAVLLAISGGVIALLRGDASALAPTDPEAERAVEALPDAAPPRSVAVLPLENQSPAPEDAYLAGAFTDQLTTSLGRAGLHVPSRTSAMRFADTTLDARSIAAALGVGHLLEGSVQRIEDRIRVNLSLIDAGEDRPAWQEEYERPFADILHLQSEIAAEVARELQSTFSQADWERMVAGTDDPLAWDLFQRATQMPTTAEAEPLIREALALDSTFATAWVMLGGHYFTTREDPHWRDSTRVANERALRHARDPTLRLLIRALETSARGEVEFSDEWMAETRRTVQEFPNDAILVSLLAGAHERRGELTDAVRWTRRWVVLDPMNSSAWVSLGRLYRVLEMGEEAEGALLRALNLRDSKADSELLRLYWNQGRFEEALAQAAELGDFGRLARGGILNWAGRTGEAHEVLEAALAELDFATRHSWAPEIIHARRAVGDTAGSGALLARAEDRAAWRVDIDPDLRWSLVQFPALRGDVEQADARLSEYVVAGYRDAWTLRHDPILEEARADSAFAATLAELTETVHEARETVRRMPDETQRL